METKICPVCGGEINDEALASCPLCGAVLTEAEGVELPQDEAQTTSSKLKFAVSCLSVVLAILILALCWHMYSKNKSINLMTYTYKSCGRIKDLTKADVNGLYSDYVSGMYFDFENKKTKADFSDALPGDASADSAALSDGLSKTRTQTFDGTYESGFTDDYVQRVLANIYISQNALQEEYESYLEEKSLVIDDYYGFIKEKGVAQSELDDIDKTQNISAQGKSYTQTGYWNFDSETGEIYLFDSQGTELAALMIVGDVIVDPTGYLQGDVFEDSLFDAKYTYSKDDYTEALSLYHDGNYVVKSQYDSGDSQHFVGSYKSDSDYIVLEADGQKMTYSKIKGGISFITYKKQ